MPGSNAAILIKGAQTNLVQAARVRSKLLKAAGMSHFH